MKEQIDAYLEDHKTEILQDIQALVSIRSVYGNIEENRRALEFVRQKAATMGISSRLTREEDVLLATIGSGKEKVGVLVHVDVVEINDLEKWTHPPFSAYFDGEYIWGRGVLDDKGAVIVSLYALKALLDLRVPLNKQIWLIVGSSEEGGTWWTDIEHLKSNFGVPDYGFSPDGDFNICNEENGYVDIELEFTEPKRDELLYLAAGKSVNTIPSKAVIHLSGEQLLKFQGVAAHSSTPELADNAIEKLTRAISHRQDLNFVRFIEQYLLEDQTGNRLGLNPAEYPSGCGLTGETICVPTVLKLTDAGVHLNINIRHKFGITREFILQQFEGLASKFGYSVKIDTFHKPMRVDKNHPALQLMKSVYGEYGYKNFFKTAHGTSYAKSLKNFVSWGPNFPDVVNCAHMENEKISMNSLMTAAKIYTLFLARCASQSTLTESNEQ